MVIRGNTRGNARQLSHYLLTMKDNEAIRILDVNGQANPQAEDLHRAVFLMDVSAELSKSEKGLYHAQINPAVGEAMDDDRWTQAADMLGEQLGLQGQSRAIVLHTKKGRTHAHVVWERYDHENQKMVSDSFSRLAQDRARKDMELAFGHAPTPHRNKHRPELKASLTVLWNQTGTGAQFVKAAGEHDYIISEGSGRSPYMVVDGNGRSYDLTRQLQGVRLKEVRQRLRHETLLNEKDAISLARRKNNDNQERSGGSGSQKAILNFKTNTMQEEFKEERDAQSANDNKPVKDQFRENKNDMNGKQGKEQQQKPDTKQQFAQNKQEATDQTKEKSVKEQFAENREDIGKSDREKEREKRREEFKQRTKAKPGQSRERGMEYD